MDHIRHIKSNEKLNTLKRTQFLFNNAWLRLNLKISRHNLAEITNLDKIFSIKAFNSENSQALYKCFLNNYGQIILFRHI